MKREYYIEHGEIMRRIVSIVSFWLFLTTVFAQFTFGPKVGYVATKLSVQQQDIKASLVESPLFGVFFRFGNRIYLQPEINWFATSSVFNRPENGDINPMKQQINLDNIQLPLSLGMKLINDRSFKLRVTGSVMANLVVNKTIDSYEADNYVNPIRKSDINDLYWGAQVGGGIDLCIFTLDAHYVMDVSNLIDSIAEDGVSIKYNSKQDGFLVSIGLKLL